MSQLKNNEFVHLHLHSEYSLLDGAIRVSDIPKLAKAAGHTAVALTDHGNMFGAVAFYRACVAEGVKPIIGCEVYVAPKSRFIKEYGKENSAYDHLVLLVENETGYRNLIALVSAGYLEGFYNKPRIDTELLEHHHAGLICLSACLGGYIQKCLARGDYAEAKDYAMRLDTMFGRDSFYLELQDHGIDLQKEVNRGLRQIAAETGIPMVATNDAHYPHRTDADTQAVLLCIQTGNVITDGRPIGFETDEFFYKSTAEMEALFPADTEALCNTGKIAARCSYAFTFDKLYLPVYQTPDGIPASTYLRQLTEEGYRKKTENGSICFTDSHPAAEYRARIDYELSVICAMGYAEYYLIVWDFINYAKNTGIPVGPGRGSGAGSLVAYLIGITDVDSIRYDLMFERFLNPERVSMPDFDIDFSDVRRGEVIDYVKRRYGEDHVAQIITFGTLAARAAVRDVGRALGFSYAETDAVAKAIPQELGMTLDKALENRELKAQYDGDKRIRQLLDTAKALEGMPRHASTHAAGVVITDRPVASYVPLAENGGMPVTQFDMDTVAALGLLKIDFLGLRYLSIIDDAEKMIREHTPEFDVTRVPFDDAETYEMLAQGKTAGVFQLESAGMRAMLTQLQPDNLEMIVAAISLYRPGPMDAIPKFIDNRLHPDKIVYPTPVLKPILDVTFGCIVYQEQVMQICRAVAGYSYARADLVRRAMAKKKTDVMEKEREFFINGKQNADGTCEIMGAVANGIPAEVADALFDEMASFAKYAFNKSHASAYAFTAYRTAYLKRHYPGEYLASLLTSVSGNIGATAEYVAEANRLHIPVLAPDINESREQYHVSATPDGKRGIRFGLLAVKNVGVKFVMEILTERAHGSFADFEDFISRMSAGDCSKRQVEALLRAGAFDRLPKEKANRRQLLIGYEQMIDDYQSRSRTAITGQMDLFSAPLSESDEDTMTGTASRIGFLYPELPDFSLKEKLVMEHEATGQYFSGHLLDDYSRHLADLRPSSMPEILSAFSEGEEESTAEAAPQTKLYHDKQLVLVAGMVTKRVTKMTKNGGQMAFIRLEDRFAEMEIVIFPKVLEGSAALLQPDTAIAVTGELSAREEEEPKILARTVFPLQSNTVYTQQKQPETPTQVQTQTQTAVSPQVSGDVALPLHPRILYLRVPSVSDTCYPFLKARNLAEIFSGNIPVVFYSEETKQYTKNLVSGTMLTPFILSEYERILGKDNVIAKP